MAQFRSAVITQKGIALIQKTQMQNISLEFLRIVTGSGEYAEAEALGNLESLKEPRQEFPISSVTSIDEQTVKLSSVLSNEGLEEPYYMREIGVYASDPDEGEILYSLSVAYPGKADYLPAYDNTVPVAIGLDTYQSVSNTENVSIRADPGAYALSQDLEELSGVVVALISALFDLDGIKEQFDIVYFGGSMDTDPEAMTAADISIAIATSWNGESTDDETAMSAEDVETSITTEWNGESSDDETALSAQDVEEATK